VMQRRAAVIILTRMNSPNM